MFQIPQNTGFSDSMSSVSQGVPKITNMVLHVDNCIVIPDKIIINANEPINVETPNLKADDNDKITSDDNDKASFLDGIKKALGIKPKSDSEQALKEKEKARKIADSQKTWRKRVTKWQDNMVGTLKKTLTDNPIANFIKDHWGKLLIGLAFLFLKPAQMKKVWEALKGMAIWMWKEGPKIFTKTVDLLDKWVPKIFTAVEAIAKFLGTLIENVFGKSGNKEDFDKQQKVVSEKQTILNNMEKKSGWWGTESDMDFARRTKKAQKSLTEETKKRDSIGKMEGGKFKANELQGGLFGANRSVWDIIKGFASEIALVTAGITALGLIIAPGATILIGFGILKGILSKLLKWSAAAGLAGLTKVAPKVVAEVGETVVKKTGETVVKKVGETAVKKTGEAVVKKVGTEVLKEGAEGATKVVATKVGAKTLGKGAAMVAAKKLPFGIGALVSLGFAAKKAMAGDYVGAGMEVTAGAASIVPGIGTGLSLAVEGAIIARDVNKSLNGESPKTEGVTPASSTVIKPKVSPLQKTNTLKEVQGENTKLMEGVMVVAPVTNNYITNYNGGGGEGGTAIYGVPTAQQGKQHRHSNIR